MFRPSGKCQAPAGPAARRTGSGAAPRARRFRPAARRPPGRHRSAVYRGREDVVRARIEAAFGPDALARALPAARQRRRPAWGKGLLAGLSRRRRRRQARQCRRARRPARQRPASAGPGSLRHIPFTPRAKKTLQLALREAQALHDNYIGRPAPHLGPALPEGRHGAGNPVRPWRTGHTAARLHPRSLPQGELIRANPDAVAEAVALGTTVATTQPQENVRVLLDPARHPFCLCHDEG